MSKRIITISREFGSGGRFIGEEVAKKLGMAYYDKNVITEIAEKSGLSPEYIQENAELSPKKGLFAYALAGRDITGKSVEDIVYEAQKGDFGTGRERTVRDHRKKCRFYPERPGRRTECLYSRQYAGKNAADQLPI